MEVTINAIAVTIVFSIIAHGVTARPLTTRYVAASTAPRGHQIDNASPDRQGGGESRWRIRLPLPPTDAVG